MDAIIDQLDRTRLGGESQETGIVYDARMTGHELEGHPETPQRVIRIWDALTRNGYVSRCKVTKSREATKEDVLLADTEEHYQKMTSIPTLPDDQLNSLASEYDSIYMNKETFSSAIVSAGCLLEITENVVQGKLKNGIAVIRPPGHHAEEGLCSGFCIFNNVAIATRAALDRMGVKRVLIVDWDVHHGNGTQHTFWNDTRVLFFSLHRYDHGSFYPGRPDADSSYVGGPGAEGYNINVAWNDAKMGDAEYMAAFHNVLLPVAYEYNPELVIVSAGFDSAEGDPLVRAAVSSDPDDYLGSYKVSPAGYAHMTHALCALAKGKVVVALEGGYNLTSISNSMCAVAGALLGDAPPRLDSLIPNDAAIKCIRSTISEHSKYWRSLRIGVTQQQSQSNNVRKSSGSQVPQPQAEASAEPNSQPESQPVEACPDPRPGGDELHSKPTASQHQATPSKPPRPQPAVSEFQQRRHQVFTSLEEAGVEQMFAIEPLKWCKHLVEVKPLPASGEIDAFQKCEVCSTPQEVWVCLICYKNGCGRHVNQHMAQHHESTGHNMVLSLADMSVWCYACESYVYHATILPMVRAAQKSKFGS